MNRAERLTEPHDYVRENKETIVRIIKHGDDQFGRSLALAVLLEYGDDPDVEEVRLELDEAARLRQLSAES